MCGNYGLIRPATAAGDQHALIQTLLAAMKTKTRKERASDMFKTGAQALKDEGKVEGRLETQRDILLRLLQQHLGKPPAKLAAVISSTTDANQLDEWINQVYSCKSYKDLKISY